MSMYALTNYDDEHETTEASELWAMYRRALAAGRHVLVYGPPGTGKTHAAMHDGLGDRAVMRHQCQPGDTAYDILGRIGIVNGSTQYQNGPGAIAVVRGDRLVFDEADRLSDEGVSLLYSLGDRKPFVLPDGTIITPGPTTQIVLTTNADPWSLFPADSGIRDRFPFISIPEPCSEALASLPESMRATTRRAVRHGVTGLRAWQHLTDLLGDMGYGPDDLLREPEPSDDDDDGSSAMPASELPSMRAREQSAMLVSRAVFGSDGPEILRAWRVAAARDLEVRPEPMPTSELDRACRAAYARGMEAGRAERDDDECEHEHSHNTSECRACDALYDSGVDAGLESCECYHEHGTVYCSSCESLYSDGQNDHSHDSDDDGTCDECDRIRESARAETYAAIAEYFELDDELRAEVEA